MEHSEIYCMHEYAGITVISIILLSLLAYLSFNEVMDNWKEYPYYSVYYKLLKNKKFTVTPSQCYVWSTQDGILPEGKEGITFNTDLKMIRTNEFFLSARFPECIDLYQLYWWAKYWLYYIKHIKPTLQ